MNSHLIFCEIQQSSRQLQPREGGKPVKPLLSLITKIIQLLQTWYLWLGPKDLATHKSTEGIHKKWLDMRNLHLLGFSFKESGIMAIATEKGLCVWV